MIVFLITIKNNTDKKLNNCYYGWKCSPHMPQDPYGTGLRDLIIISFEKE